MQIRREKKNLKEKNKKETKMEGSVVVLDLDWIGVATPQVEDRLLCEHPFLGHVLWLSILTGHNSLVVSVIILSDRDERSPHRTLASQIAAVLFSFNYDDEQAWSYIIVYYKSYFFHYICMVRHLIS